SLGALVDALARGRSGSRTWRTAALLSLAVIALLGLGAALLRYVRASDAARATALAEQLKRTERVVAIRNNVHSTHAAMLSRWLLSLVEREARKRSVEQMVDRVRRDTDEFFALERISAREQEAADRLLIAVAGWSNRVYEATVAAQGPTEAGRDLQGL